VAVTIRGEGVVLLSSLVMKAKGIVMDRGMVANMMDMLDVKAILSVAATIAKSSGHISTKRMIVAKTLLIKVSKGLTGDHGKVGANVPRVVA